MNKTVINRWRKFISFLLALLLLLGALPTFSVNAKADDDLVKVRVGYVIYENFQEGLEGEEKRGSGYEYLQKIRYYTGWKYEYVYGSFSELYQKLVDGEIDLLTDVAYTEKRAEEVLFSRNEEGVEDYYIYSRSDDVGENDIKGIFAETRTVGVNGNSLALSNFKQWAEQYGVECNIVEFSNEKERQEFITNKKSEMIVATSLMKASLRREGWIPFQRVGSSSYYFAVSKKSEKILNELNNAQSRILAENPYYNEDVVRKYEKNTSSAQTAMTVKEKEAIEERGVYRVGYLEDFAPLCDTNRGKELTGIYSTLLKVLNSRYYMQYETVAYKTEEEMIAALNKGWIDMAFPICNDPWEASQHEVSLSSTIYTTTMTAIFKGDYSASIFGTIVIMKGNHSHAKYVADYYPNAKVIEAENPKQAIELVTSGEATCCFAVTDCYNVSSDEYKGTEKLSSTTLSNTIDLCIALKRNDSYTLSVVNRAINLIGEEGIKSELVRYATIESQFTWEAFIIDNIMYILLIAMLIIVLIVAVAIIKVHKTNLVKEELANATKMAEEAQKIAENANRAKTEFLNHMSHDIRTPINGVMGLLDIIQKNRQDDEKVDESLEKIRTSAGHLLSLVNDVLDMSKLESGRSELDEVAFDLSAMLKEADDILEIQYQTAEISYFSHREELEHRYVYGSPIHLKQIILNLGSNAMKYNKANGTVDTYFKEIGLTGDVVTYQFVIADTGIGMDKDFVNKELFEPFTQANSSARTKYKGTGLGMPIVKKLIDHMGGKITVESIVGIGSTFTVEIPMKICSQEDIDSIINVDGNNDISGMNILIVEDNDLNMEIVEFMLEDENVTYQKAFNGQEALNIFKKSKLNEFDLILMDVMMPIMDGLSTTRFIRSLNREDAKTVPIIAMTANAFVEDAIKAREAGMNEHLAKPLSRDTLIGTIAKHKKRTP